MIQPLIPVERREKDYGMDVIGFRCIFGSFMPDGASECS